MNDTIPHNLGIIPDGNRRFARLAGMSTAEGYLGAARKAIEVIGWCREAGVAHVSAFGVSQENIALRPREEVVSLHEALFRFCEEVQCLPGVALHLFGDAATLPEFVPRRSELACMAAPSPKNEVALIVHVGLNYSAQAELGALVHAVACHGSEAVARAPEDFCLAAGIAPIDLVIRTGGHQRLSGFLPFHTAYAELWFTETLWPAFGRDEFQCALGWYARQARHFGE